MTISPPAAQHQQQFFCAMSGTLSSTDLVGRLTTMPFGLTATGLTTGLTWVGISPLAVTVDANRNPERTGSSLRIRTPYRLCERKIAQRLERTRVRQRECSMTLRAAHHPGDAMDYSTICGRPLSPVSFLREKTVTRSTG